MSVRLDDIINARPEPAPGALQPNLPDIPVEDYENVKIRPVAEHRRLNQFFRDQITKFRDATRAEYRRYHVRNLRNQKYLQGEQFWDIDPESGQLYQMTPEREWAYIDNQFEYYVEAIVSNMLKSAPRLVVKADTDDRKVQEDLRQAQHWVDCDKPIGDREAAIESYLCLLRSRAWYYTCPVMADDTITRPAYKKMEMGAGPSAFYCPDCGRGGYLDGVQGQVPSEGAAAPPPGGMPGMPAPSDMAGNGATCPQCGSGNVAVLDAESATGMATDGEKEGKRVTIRTEVVDDFEMGWYLPAGTPEESPVLWRERMMLLEELQELYPWYEAGKMGSSSQAHGLDFNLRYKDELTRSPGNWHTDPYVVGANTQRVGAADTLRRRYLEAWFKPHMYGNYTFAEPIQLASGKVIPAGVPLKQIYPKGCCVVWSEDQLIDIRKENKDEHWDNFEYKPNPAGGQARGAETLTALQDMHNAMRVFQMVHVATEANGTLFLNPKKVTSAAARKNVNRPGRVVYVDNLLPGEDIRQNVAFRLGGGSFPGESLEIDRDALGSMQAHSQTYSVNPNADKAPINTATGVNEMASQIAQMTEPRLQRRAEVRAKIATKRLAFAMRYCWDPTYQSAHAKGGGRDRGMWIAPAKLSGPFRCEFDPDSHQVRTRDQQKSDVAIGVPLVTQLMEAGQPNLVEIVLKVFRLDELVNDGVIMWENVAYRRIDNINDLAAQVEPQLALATVQLQMQMQNMPPQVDPQTGQVIDPVQMLLQQTAHKIALEVAKPDPRDDDDVIVKVFQKYHGTPEGQGCSELASQSQLAAMALQMNNKAQKAILLQQMAVMGQMQAEAPLRQQQAQDQEAQAASEHERSESAAEADAERKNKAAEDQFDREQQLQAMTPTGPQGTTP